MSNYQEGSDTYNGGTTSSGGSYQEPTPGGSNAFQGAPQGGGPQHETAAFTPPGAQQQWIGQPGYQDQGRQSHGHQDQGHQSHGHQSHGHQSHGQGMFQGGNPFSSNNNHSLKVRRTFKTTEFWVLVVVSLALLIAAAVTDQGADNQSFGAHDAWKYVTWLAIAYILSRGFTKFAGHERDRGNDRSDGH